MTTTPTAQRRCDYTPPTHTITDITLDVILHPTKTMVTATSKVVQQGSSTDFFLHGESLTLQSVAINGTPTQEYTLTGEGITLHNLPSSCSVTIINTINPQENLAFEGLYKSGDAYCTQCEAEGFRRITYSLDRPDVLSIFTTTITAPQKEFPYLLSNGNKVSEETLEKGLHRVTWHDPFPKPTYLFALVAGDFEVARDTFITRSGNEVALEIFVDKGNLHRTPHALQSLKNAMKWDEERFNREYDLAIYMVVAVGFFNMGAMENKGLNVFNDKYVLASPDSATDSDYLNIEAVIGHEYFHNWSGNRVTCRDWFQLSLKEGLTVFRDQEFSSDLGSRAVNRIKNVRFLRTHQFAEDAGPMAHPIRPEEVMEQNNFYTVTVYEKGAEIIRMLHTILGETTFMKGMDTYFATYDGQAVTCDDFVDSLEQISPLDLTQFRRWYSQSGTPELTVTTSYNTTTEEFTLTLSQETKPTADQKEKKELVIPFVFSLLGAEGTPLLINNKKEEMILLTQKIESFTFTGIAQKPILSALHEFSAPVKMNFTQSTQELLLLAQKSPNSFTRWDSAQTLIKEGLTHCINGKESLDTILNSALLPLFTKTLKDSTTDPALLAEILTLPTESEIGSWFAIVPVDTITQTLKALNKELAHTLENEFLHRFNTLSPEDSDLSHTAMAQRALRDTLLGYLAYTPQGEKLIEEQYHTATSMTTSLAALTASVDAQLACSTNLLAHFNTTWHSDGLVMDKWFALQASVASPTTLSTVKKLMSHPAFDIKNPNRIRSLIGSFSRNQSSFHALDGSGYQFLREILTTLNQSNPQVAARLIEPLLSFKRYDTQRQELMKTVLKNLAKLDNLAKDLFEKISKTLG